MTPTRYLTISVDDGHPLDMKAADLLLRYDLSATFYIPVNNPERPVMDKTCVSELASSYEIGAHTYNHVALPGLAPAHIRKELFEGKDWLEQLIGMPVGSFCYPKGKFNKKVIAEVRDAGFIGARTCMHNLNIFPSDPMLWGLSTQAYSHSSSIHVRHALKELNFRGLFDFYRVHQGSVDWVEHFKHGVRHVENNGGVAHLYFHSWEIDEQEDWQRLENLFKFLKNDCDLFRCTNGELFKLYYKRDNYEEHETRGN